MSEEIKKFLPDSVRLKLNELCEQNKDASDRVMIEIGYLAGINEGDQWWETAFESCNKERIEYRDKMDACYAEYQSLHKAYNSTQQMDEISRLQSENSRLKAENEELIAGIRRSQHLCENLKWDDGTAEGLTANQKANIELRKEVERLKAENDKKDTYIHDANAKILEQFNVISRLKAERERVTVWVVHSGCIYEGGGLDCVCATEEIARHEAIKKVNKENTEKAEWNKENGDDTFGMYKEEEPDFWSNGMDYIRVREERILNHKD